MRNKKEFTERIEKMFNCLSSGRDEVQPSKFWIELNKQHMTELTQHGFENFKQTITRQYFSFIPIFLMNTQILFLIRKLSPLKTIKNFISSLLIHKHSGFNCIDSVGINFLTLMIWDYVKLHEKEKLLMKLSEPLVGNPPKIFSENRLISQDLANSVMEYKSITEGINTSNIRYICELGAGSGRNAYVFLSLMPNIKYIIIDIPPSLAVSERYLSKIFPKKKIFKFRPFHSFEKIKREFEKSDILFFTSNQIEYLPSKIIDLFINISSLHEMRMDQIKYFFKQIERLTKKGGYFYFKEWKKAYVPYEKIYIKMEDYPIKPKWNLIFMREAVIQTKFFEALLQLK